MGRKEGAQLELVIPDEEAGLRAASTTARRARSRSEKHRGWRERLRLWALWCGAVAAAIAAVALAYRLDEFLAGDRHFALAPADAPGGAGVRIEGAVYASRARLLDIFALDVGRSIYLIPLAQRRRSVLGIEWVRSASIRREWPDHIAIRIRERTPVAFAMLPIAGQAYRTALIDAEGVLLPMPVRARFNLPVLFGLHPGQRAADRRDRVRRMLQLLDDLGPYARQISDIDVSDPENLKVTQTVEGRAVRLWLGKQHFLLRVNNFLNHYGEIRRRLPYAATFDMRLEDRITSLDAPPSPKHGGALGK